MGSKKNKFRTGKTHIASTIDGKLVVRSLFYIAEAG